MPIVEVTLVEGRESARLRTLITQLTDSVQRALEVPRESVRVVIREIPPSLWAAGDVTILERRESEKTPAEGPG